LRIDGKEEIEMNGLEAIKAHDITCKHGEEWIVDVNSVMVCERIGTCLGIGIGLAIVVISIIGSLIWALCS
jgi:hypothetical protein